MSPDFWTLFADLGAGVGGIGAAAAAIASWRSANTSREISRDSQEALGIAMRPYLAVRTIYGTAGDRGLQDGTFSLEIDNTSSWPAHNVSAEIRYRDGHVDRDRREFIAPNNPPPGVRYDERWKVLLPAVGLIRTRNDVFGDARDVIEAVVITYSDQRDIARYELRIPSSQGSAGDPFDSGHGLETRIS
jgi:hypothetical protein